MCIGIAIDAELLSEVFIARFGLRERLRGDLFDSPLELRWQYRDRVPQLPVVRPDESEWDLLAWGNRDDRASRLPQTGWAREESLGAGKWKHLRPKEVCIPASRGLEKGVWFPIAGGLRGIEVLDERQRPHVYMLTRASTTEYHELTRHDRMPLIVEQL